MTLPPGGRLDARMLADLPRVASRHAALDEGATLSLSATVGVCAIHGINTLYSTVRTVL
jgi:hypothetical protein